VRRASWTIASKAQGSPLSGFLSLCPAGAPSQIQSVVSLVGSAIIFAGVIVLASLSQSLGLVAPIFFDFWVRQDKAEHGKCCGRGEDDNQTHVRSFVVVGLGAQG
jgi:hypothetical protein